MSKLSLGANAAHSGPASVLAFKSMRNTHRVTKQVRHPVLSAGMLAVMMAGSAAVTLGQESEGQAGPLVLKQGYFYVAGAYDNPAAPTSMSGQMYVEYQIPAELRAGAYPIIMVHGGGHTGAGFQSTPDGRPGWADYFIGHGWPVYVVDQPGRAKSPYVDAVYGALGSPPAVTQAENLWSASEKASPAVQWPQATLHTQWPGNGSHTHGDPVFDQYYAHLAPGISNGALQEKLTANALVALLEKLGPSIVLIHSQPGTALWVMADTRPDLVKALVAVEPSGPPIYGEIVPNPPLAGPPVARPWGPSINRLTYDPATTDPSQLSIVHQAQPDGPGLTACWLQAEPARQLPRLAGLPILHLLSQSSYHAPYDHCTTKWLNQAGVPTDFVKLTGLGIFGNGHLMAVEKNNLEIAGVIERWLVQTLGHAPGEPRKLPETERSLGNVEIAEQGVFFVGGAYNDPVNPTFMSGQMYVRYQIPKERNKGAYPVVLVHGGGQLGTSFTGTPDDRSGWADYLLSHGGGLPAEPRLPGVRRGSAGARQVAVHHCGLRPERRAESAEYRGPVHGAGAGQSVAAGALAHPVAGNRSSGRLRLRSVLRLAVVRHERHDAGANDQSSAGGAAGEDRAGFPHHPFPVGTSWVGGGGRPAGSGEGDHRRRAERASLL